MCHSRNILFRNVYIDLNKTVFKPDGGQFAKSHKLVSVIPLSFSIKRRNKTKIYRPIASHIISGSHGVIGCFVGPVVGCPNTFDYIRERNLMKCHWTESVVFTINCHILAKSVSE